ncbi:unnamed protein product, partial [Rotaria sp. Silwood1]
MELKAFAYRCFYSKKFHLLIRPELLTVSIQDKFIELLLQIINLDSGRRFQFGVITSSDEKNQPLINSLRTLELLHPIYDHQMLNKHDLKKETEKFLGKNCYLVTSSMAGLGKSTLIRNRIQESGKQYLKFPISGHIDLETLVGRLRTCISQSSTQELAIHIDIGIVLDISKLHEFLYCILLFRSFCYGLLAINLLAEAPIYIELDSSPQMTSLYEKLTILEHLQKVDIPHIEWKQMNMKCLPGIQLVANYLQVIQDKSISQEEINEEKLVELDAVTCSKLLLEQFSLKDDRKQISWTSIKILVTIYRYLFLGFSKCEYFFLERPKVSQLRIDILQYLLNSSKQFTSFSVESVRKNQRSASDGIIQLDEAIIRWDKLQPFTVIFTEWNDPLFVYKNINDVPRSLIDTVVAPVQANIFYRVLFSSRLKHEQQQREQAQFPDHNQLKHEDFFMRLAALSKKYYSKPVCNSCFKQYEDTDQTCASCGNKSQLLRPKTAEELDIKDFQMKIANQLEKEYVWTADNYIKALLIYLRIQCRLPVILIGETENDPPFLNRFEKHVVDRDSLIHRCYTIIASNLLQWIDSLATYSLNKHFPQRKNLFVDYNPDNVRLLVMDAFDSLKISEDYSENQRDIIIEFCKEKLIRTSSFDLPLLLSCHIKNNDKLKMLIDQYYKIHKQLSFSNIIDQALEEKMIPNQVIYTYTQIYDKIEYLNYNSLVMEIKIGGFKSEFELKTKIKEHYQSKNKRLLLIRVDYHHEYKHLLFLKHLIQNGSIESSDHGVWLVLHLQRNLMDKIQDDILFNGWCPVMIDNLNQKELMQIDVLTNPSYRNLLDHADFSLSHTMFNELVTQSFVRVRYTVRCKNKEGLINQRRDSIFDLLTLGSVDTESLNEVVKTHLIELIKAADLDYVRSESKDWRQDLLNNPTIVGSCRSINSALQMTVLLFYCNYFLAFLVEAEKSSLFDSCHFLISKRNENMYKSLRCIWLDCLRSVFQSIPRTITIMDTVEIPLIFDLRLPCARLERQIIRQIYEMIKNGDENLDVNLSEDKLLALAMEKLRSTSVYGKNIQDILDDTNLFKHYFHDQIAILLDELGINHLSVSFAQKLLTMNPSLTVENKMKYFLLDQDELIKLLNLFEIGLEIIGEDKWQFEEQFLIFNKTKIVTFNNPTNLYVLIQVEQQFYQILPQESFDSDRIYECNGDPLIETSLMNLIELLVSSTVIDRADDIVQLSTAYDFIVQ